MNRLPTAAGGPPIWDHCVICGDPAYRYPPGLHIFPRMQDRDAEFSYNFLYEIFCDNLGITEHSQLRLLWNFRELSFPFCNDCETLLSDVASRSIEIGEQAFEPAIFKRMIINEYKFIDQNIYRQHNSRYLRLRDAVLGTYFQGLHLYEELGVARFPGLADDARPWNLYTEVLLDEPTEQVADE